jgi:hypothetical protein
MNVPFIKGLELSTRFEEIVRPILLSHYPGLKFATARLEHGSDVLGFDTPMSRDHDWGPRFSLFLDPADFPLLHQEIDTMLSNELPFEVLGYPTNFGYHEDTTRWMEERHEYPISHKINITTPQDFFKSYLGVDAPCHVSITDWLSLPSQKLRTIQSGRIFYDTLSTLTTGKENLSWYPQDVWYYLLASQWRRLDQYEPFMGRCGDVGDELGSILVAASLVEDMMRLCFLYEKQYAPYIKWFGTAFDLLECAPLLKPFLSDTIQLSGWKQREDPLIRPFQTMADIHNQSGITAPLTTEVGLFYGRPYRVLSSGRFVDAIIAKIIDPEVKKLPQYIGAINQISDSTDILENPEFNQPMKQFYHLVGTAQSI